MVKYEMVYDKLSVEWTQLPFNNTGCPGYDN